MDACYRVPIRLTETRTQYTPAGGPVPRGSGPGRRTKVVHGPRWPIVTAPDAIAARDKVAEMYPGAEIGEPEFLHRGRVHNGPTNATSDRLHRMGFR